MSKDIQRVSEEPATEVHLGASFMASRARRARRARSSKAR